MSRINLQPTLKNEFVTIRPLTPDDFETLYQVASDPMIWEQHPNKDRYRRNVFENFFKGAIESKGAFMVYDSETLKPIGSSRYYTDYNNLELDSNQIAIGYTFLARDHWGTTYNKALKTLMMDHAFKYVDTVLYHIGAQNIRSQKAMERLGGIKMKEIEVAFYGEPSKLNFEYHINKTDWYNRSGVSIELYQDQFKDEVSLLILGIQQNEFGIPITLDDQPDLLQIRMFYQTGKGNFWIARVKGECVGTIGLLDLGNGNVALRKMFVKAPFRGHSYGIAQSLLNTSIAWSKRNQVHDVFLGTTEKFLAAHRFYERNGFSLVNPDVLPAEFPVMKVDTKFYRYTI